MAVCEGSRDRSRRRAAVWRARVERFGFVALAAVALSVGPGRAQSPGMSATPLGVEASRQTVGLSIPAAQSDKAGASATDLVAAVLPTADARPRRRPELPNQRCTSDRAHCISLTRYIPDTCRVIEATATEAGLDAHFFARLLWQESRFDPSAVSPAGARGIAQFMPATAARRGLADPFNPAAAMRASAHYLAELRDLYGNLGLAAAAYNAGEGRVEDFLRVDRILPRETRAYVSIITGLNADLWRDSPPRAIDLTLDADAPFTDACAALAAGREPDRFRSDPGLHPWAVVLSAHRSRDIAAHRIARLPGWVGDQHEITFARVRLPGHGRRQMTAQIGADSRAEADRLCRRFKANRVFCVVARN